MSAVTDLFSRYGVPFVEGGRHRNVREGWVGTECPYCLPGASGGFKMGWKDANHCSCWSCGSKPAGKTLSLLLRIPEEEVRKLGLWKDKIPSTEQREMPAGVYTPPPGVGPLLKAHKTYLRSRRFDPDELGAVWGVQGIGHLGGRMAWRLFAPVVAGGKEVSWTTRSLKDSGLRYLSAKPAEEAMPMRHTLYGWDWVTNAAILFEGPADCWAVGPGAVASMGLGYSRRQVAMLSRLAVRYIAFDSEPAAQRRARELARQLAGFPGGTYLIAVEGAKDAAGAPERERTALRALLR